MNESRAQARSYEPYDQNHDADRVAVQRRPARPKQRPMSQVIEGPVLRENLVIKGMALHELPEGDQQVALVIPYRKPAIEAEVSRADEEGRRHRKEENRAGVA